MSGALPTTPAFRTYELKSMDPSNLSLSQSGKRFVDKLPGHLWSIKAKYPLLEEDDFWTLYGFAMKQRGKYGTFTVQIPKTNRGAYGGTPLVNGASQTGTSLIIDGATPNVTGWAKAGDIINIAGTTKVYMITDDADSDGGGNVTLSLMANLISSPADNAAITTSSVNFTMSFANDDQIVNASPGIFYDFELDMIEAL